VKLGHKLVVGFMLFSGLLMFGGAGPASSQKIEIVAKRFAFLPGQITVKKGQPVTLVLRTQDVTHGLAIKELGIKAEIPKGHDTEVTFTPDEAGTFEGKCSHFCGSGHGSMKFTVVVTE
jgi:cytochrome c oxidase subunit 2